jgi:hypothetical protein
MCDYSLMAIPNRLAVFGEELVVHKFEHGPAIPAVCIPPGGWIAEGLGIPFFTPITSPPARSWLRLDLRTKDIHEAGEFRHPDN